MVIKLEIICEKANGFIKSDNLYTAKTVLRD